MADVLIVSDVSWVRDDVKAVLSPSDTVREVSGGVDALAAVASRAPDVVVLDLQTGAMGGIATCLELRLEESGGRLPHVPVLLLLDRRPDVFLARRADADGWVLKPLDPIRLRGAIRAVLGGGSYDDTTRAPVPVLVTAGAIAETAADDNAEPVREGDGAEAVAAVEDQGAGADG